MEKNLSVVTMEKEKLVTRMYSACILTFVLAGVIIAKGNEISKLKEEMYFRSKMEFESGMCTSPSWIKKWKESRLSTREKEWGRKNCPYGQW